MYLDEFAARATRMALEYEEPLKYLAGRGFNKEDIEKWGFGYLKVAKISKENTTEYKEFHDETYGFKVLENRIIIPLKNLIGKVNGLVVRPIEEKRYKLYLLGEAKKIGGWFGLYEAVPHILKTRRVFVHEGAFNSAAFSKVFQNTVSSLTSFINDQQYETLRMFADLIILVYDDDEAGRIGSYTLKKRYGKCIESITVGYKDTNSCLEKMGYSSFVKFIRTKVPFMLQN
jgi:DNA primase